MLPQLPQPYLAAFRDRRLSNEPPEDQLTGRVQPAIRQRIDHVAPDPSLDRIKTGREGAGDRNRGQWG
jgi:hypothetical protein